VRRSRWQTLCADLRRDSDEIQLREFLERYDHRLEDIYRRDSWTQLRRDADRATTTPADAGFEARTLKALSRLTHIDDPERVAFYGELLSRPSAVDERGLDLRQRRLLTMLAWGLGSGESGAASVPEYFKRLWPEHAVRRELVELLDALDARSHTRSAPSVLPAEIPLTLHARYSRQEVVAALGSGEGVKPKVTQGGILWVPQAGSDVFFVDLHKSERDYSPTTMYRDYAINRELFHWESQSRQTPRHPTVQRYIAHQERGTRVLLFVRERKNFELGTMPFMFLGPVTYVDHRGERPVAFTWRLPVPMPEELFEVARSVAAA
jgi:hypothetical protein